MLVEYNHGIEGENHQKEKKGDKKIFTGDKWIESEHLQETICILQKKFGLAFLQCNLSIVCPLPPAHPHYRDQNANKFYINSTWQNYRKAYISSHKREYNLHSALSA